MTLPSYQCTLRDDRTSQCVAQSCNLAHNTITRSPARPFFSVPSASSSSSMTSATSATTIPPDKLVRSLLSGVNPGLSVQGLEAVPSSRLQLLYNVKVSEGPSLLLTLPPPAVMRLLRSEKSSIGSEAAVLKWLSDPSTNNISSNLNPKAKSSARDMSASRNSGEESTSSQRAANSLSGYLPILVKHESMSGGLAVECNLSRPPRGVAISSLPRPLDHRERRVVDFQTGRLLRCISSQLSPTRRFGIAADVLSVPPPAFATRRLEGSLHASKGADCWSVAFHSLLESILRDGEDLAIVMSYASIRRHFDRFEHLLDAVTKPRLVVVDAGEDSNTLVFRPLETRKKRYLIPESTNGQRSESKTSQGSSRPSTTKTPTEGRQRYNDDTDSDDGEDSTHETDMQSTGQVEVTGLRQWTNCLFGDPLIASVFSKHPSRDFWNGFDRPPSGDQKLSASSIVEDEPNAHIRLLLYECYHAAVAVVREFYRPQTDSSKRELVARKQLTGVLARLDELDDGGDMRRRRPSGEVSPAKRPKSGDEDGSTY